jgi:dihydrodipicolinate synthase/N-acetylneuraminate lyase
MATRMTLLCRTATTFRPDKTLDEDALAAFLTRLVDCDLGVYLGSAGSGEGHALSPDELRRVYRIGVEVSGDRVQANANPPEQHTVANTIAHAQIAIDAGINVINLYGPTTWHGFKPNDAELTAYFDEVLAEIKHPIALAPNPIIGYTPSPALVADICNRHHQVVAVNLAGLRDSYFLQVQDALTRDVEIYVPFMSSLHTLGMGATGLLGAEANILPKTFRRYIDLYQAEERDEAELATVYAHLLRFNAYVAPWHTSSPRWIKMAMLALDLPGAAGGVRDPYRLAGAEELDRFATGLAKLQIPELDEMLAG